jgi:hypothetical protein
MIASKPCRRTLYGCAQRGRGSTLSHGTLGWIDAGNLVIGLAIAIVHRGCLPRGRALGKTKSPGFAGLLVHFRGDGGARTHVEGFADPCLGRMLRVYVAKVATNTGCLCRAAHDGNRDQAPKGLLPRPFGAAYYRVSQRSWKLLGWSTTSRCPTSIPSGAIGPKIAKLTEHPSKIVVEWVRRGTPLNLRGCRHSHPRQPDRRQIRVIALGF